MSRADDARYNLDGHDVDGSHLFVDFVKGVGVTSLQRLSTFFCHFKFISFINRFEVVDACEFDRILDGFTNALLHILFQQ